MSDTLVTPGTGLSDPSPTTDTGPTSGGGYSSWSKGKKTAVIGGGFAVLAIGAYILAKRKSTSTATSTTGSAGTQATSSTTPTLVLPSSNQDSTDSSNYASLATGLGSLANQVSALQTSQVPVPTTPVTPAPTPTPSPAPTPAPAPVSQPSVPNYYALTQNALDYDLYHNVPVFQSGVEALNWDQANGVNPGGTDPNSYYQLSTPAALALFNTGQPLYGVTTN